MILHNQTHNFLHEMMIMTHGLYSVADSQWTDTRHHSLQRRQSTIVSRDSGRATAYYIMRAVAQSYTRVRQAP